MELRMGRNVASGVHRGWAASLLWRQEGEGWKGSSPCKLGHASMGVTHRAPQVVCTAHDNGKACALGTHKASAV